MLNKKIKVLLGKYASLEKIEVKEDIGNITLERKNKGLIENVRITVNEDGTLDINADGTLKIMPNASNHIKVEWNRR